jgi:hypothetical protein
MVGGGGDIPIALRAPKLEGPRGKNPTSLYGQFTPACTHNQRISACITLFNNAMKL